jgi:hypothetical protein
MQRADRSTNAGKLDSPQDAPVTPTPAAPATVVYPQSLIDDFNNNELAANAKYRGQALLISGTVGSVSTDIFDKPYLIFAERHGFDAVSAHFTDGQTSQLQRLNKGDQVLVLCTKIERSMGMPRAEHCHLSNR